MTLHLAAGYWPNGPTFAAPRDWSDAVLSEGVESGRQPGRYRRFAKKKRTSGAETPDPAVAKEYLRIWLEQNDQETESWYSLKMFVQFNSN